jgi:division protein CdvB (Snf7/Vps24/ESCRT-III family)
MAMEFDTHIIWNIILTLIVMPLAWWIRTSHDEIRRQDILLNKTREEIARDYVSKRELEQDLTRILNAIQKLSEKLDRMQEAATKEFRL